MTETLLTTPRLLLKGMNPAFIHELFNTKQKEEIMAFLALDESGYERYKSMHEKGMETNRLSAFHFLLIHKESNRPIGECGFHTWNIYHNRAEIFYDLRSDADKRQGYMTEAIAAVLEYGYNQLNLHRVEALVGNFNTPSIKLLQRYGFTFEGTMREDYFFDGKQESSDCYSLLKHEWSRL